MRLQLLLIVGILFGISIQAVASNLVKAPSKGAPAALAIVPTPVPTSTPIPVAVKTLAVSKVISTPTATLTPVLPGVTVWPNISKGGQSILFKAPSDPGTPIQLSITTVSSQAVFQTSFSKTGRSGGHVWRLQNQAGSPVADGTYVYVLRFKQQGQNVTAQGKVSVVR